MMASASTTTATSSSRQEQREDGIVTTDKQQLQSPQTISLAPTTSTTVESSKRNEKRLVVVRNRDKRPFADPPPPPGNDTGDNNYYSPWLAPTLLLLNVSSALFWGLYGSSRIVLLDPRSVLAALSLAVILQQMILRCLPDPIVLQGRRRRGSSTLRDLLQVVGVPSWREEAPALERALKDSPRYEEGSRQEILTSASTNAMVTTTTSLGVCKSAKGSSTSTGDSVSVTVDLENRRLQAAEAVATTTTRNLYCDSTMCTPIEKKKEVATSGPAQVTPTIMTTTPQAAPIDFDSNHQEASLASVENLSSHPPAAHIITPDAKTKTTTTVASSPPDVHPFLDQLANMLADDADNPNRDIIEWTNNNNKIQVHHPGRLETELLQRYFGHSNFYSFQRQLFCCGFRKLATADENNNNNSPSPCSYFHPTMDIRKLIKLKQQKSKKKGATASIMQDHQPDDDDQDEDDSDSSADSLDTDDEDDLPISRLLTKMTTTTTASTFSPVKEEEDEEESSYDDDEEEDDDLPVSQMTASNATTTAVTCQGQNRDGTPCRKPPNAGSLYCRWHVGGEEESPYDDDRNPHGEMLQQMWLIRFRELKEFQRRHGHCNVSATNPSHSSELGRWVMRQRGTYKRDKLSNDRKKLLDSIGFTWSRRKRENKQDCISRYCQGGKHFGGPCTNPPRLGSVYCRWHGGESEGGGAAVVDEASNNKDTDAPNSHEPLLLDGIEVPTTSNNSPQEDSWLESFHQLQDFQQRHGHCNMSLNGKLGRWVGSQRAAFKNNQLALDRRKLLDGIGFDWRLNRPELEEEEDDHDDGICHEHATSSHAQEMWLENFRHLQEFQRRYGHCNVSASKASHDNKLGRWVARQRLLCRNDKLPLYRISLLDGIGFDWRSTAKRAQEREVVEEFTSSDESEDPNELWDLKEILSKAKILQTDGEATIFCSHDHCNLQACSLWVSESDQTPWYSCVDCQEDDFGGWPEAEELPVDDLEKGHVDVIRLYCSKKSKAAMPIFDSKQEAAPKEHEWDDYLLQAKEFLQAHGHCRIPQNYPANPGLGSWSHTQRRELQMHEIKGQTDLTKTQIEQLRALGMDFDATNAYWYDRISELHEHVHAEECSIEDLHKVNRTLSDWVERQRHEYHLFQQKKRSTITKERIELLEEIKGFSWGNPHPQLEDAEKNWNDWCSELKRYMSENHGNIQRLKQINSGLYGWFKRQRREYVLFREHEPTTMTLEQVKSLEEITGFQWETTQSTPAEKLWNDRFDELRCYFDNNEEDGYDLDNLKDRKPHLDRWVRQQRCEYAAFQGSKPTNMTDEKIRLLGELDGFYWTRQSSYDAVDKYWKARLEDLRQHGRLHGGFDNLKETNPQLNTWVEYQNEAYRLLQLNQTTTMTSERINLLEEIDGFDWEMAKVSQIATGSASQDQSAIPSTDRPAEETENEEAHAAQRPHKKARLELTDGERGSENKASQFGEDQINEEDLKTEGAQDQVRLESTDEKAAKVGEGVGMSETANAARSPPQDQPTSPTMKRTEAAKNEETSVAQRPQKKARLESIDGGGEGFEKKAAKVGEGVGMSETANAARSPSQDQSTSPTMKRAEAAKNEETSVAQRPQKKARRESIDGGGEGFEKKAFLLGEEAANEEEMMAQSPQGELRLESDAGKFCKEKAFLIGEGVEAYWKNRLEELRQHIQIHGRLNNLKENNPNLNAWVEYQRGAYRLLQLNRNTTMTSERINLLEAIDGFNWESSALQIAGSDPTQDQFIPSTGHKVEQAGNEPKCVVDAKEEDYCKKTTFSSVSDAMKTSILQM